MINPSVTTTTTTTTMTMTMTTATTPNTTPRYTRLNTPVGRWLLTGDESGLSQLHRETPDRVIVPDEDALEDAGFFSEAIQQLQAYFAGELQQFTLTLNPQGTPFQQSVWSGLQRIPFAQTISYGELAKRIDNPKACRAVGRANGANPIPIIIPCHRVIGSTGALVGFTAGLDLKAWLLNHESGLFVSHG
jgi:methylated-DNA-[protein]-cysteine S-methyltransferase